MELPGWSVVERSPSLPSSVFAACTGGALAVAGPGATPGGEVTSAHSLPWPSFECFTEENLGREETKGTTQADCEDSATKSTSVYDGAAKSHLEPPQNSRL